MTSRNTGANAGRPGPESRLARRRAGVCRPLLCGLACLLLAGCTSAPRTPSHYYLQRAPVRVAVMPSENTTDNPEASIIFDKACEEALRRKGFQVISADQVVTYTSARGLSIRELSGRKASEIGRDLKADMLLYTQISHWKTEYVIIQGRSVVAGRSRLVEVSTDALVWRLPWQFAQQSGNGGGGLGILLDAAVTALANSAFDRCSQLGEHAARYSVDTLPLPGVAP